ncbi:hypothetical protein [Sulfuricella sp.]|uniref:hypothetical protein n=1 Tax=Sulfuricella sp. TaxID=2099377 RepID=UPI002B57C616|nr:hypothetical protein [Sulfuricella sp.]HUX63957.1 hypothetical protein [Sulfuricella sp.]
MTQKELGTAKDNDLITSLTAMRRAARMAREQALLTGTAIVVMKDNKLVRVTAEEIRKQDAA